MKNHAPADRPRADAYVRRVGARWVSFRRAVIEDRPDGGYITRKVTIDFDKDGIVSVRDPDKSKAANGYLPTKGEQEDIKSEVATNPYPVYQPKLHTGLNIDAAKVLGIEARGSDFYVFWDRSREHVLAIEQRFRDKHGNKVCIIHSPWEHHGKTEWAALEPDGGLPLFGLELLPDAACTFLHEGPKAAAAMQKLARDPLAAKGHPWAAWLAGAAHLGWPGGAKNWSAVDWSPLRTAALTSLYIVADNDEPGKDAARKIAMEIDRPGREIRAIIFDDRFPAQFDLADKLPPALFDDGTYTGPNIEDLLQPVTLAGHLEEMNRTYAVVAVKGKTRVHHFEHQQLAQGYVRRVSNYMRFADFKDYHLNRKVAFRDKDGDEVSVPLGAWWLAHEKRRTYSGVVFKPGRGPEVDGCLNLWQGWGVEARPGDWSLMRAHVRDVLANGDAEADDYIMKFSAYAVQHPGEPAGVAVIFRGREGTGKGIFVRALMHIFGTHALQINSSRHLTGNFNAHLHDCCLLFADEAFWPGDKSAEGTLKRIITEPSLFIEPKGIDGFLVESVLHVFMASNQDWVVPAGLDARRYAMFDVSDRHMQDSAYFDPLYAQMMSGGYEAMLHDLLAMDLGSWRPFGNVPQNAALQGQKEHSLPTPDQALVELLDAGELPGAKPDDPCWCPTNSVRIRKDEQECVLVGIYDHIRNSTPAMRGWSDQRLRVMLRSWNCTPERRNKIWGWSFPPLAEMRKRFGGWVWSNEFEEWGGGF